jgi:hypothetical protein
MEQVSLQEDHPQIKIAADKTTPHCQEQSRTCREQWSLRALLMPVPG